MMLEMIGRYLLFGLHIPDGFLTAPVSLLWWGLTLAVLTLAVRRVGQLDEQQVPLMGVMAAFIFAAQMLNFPVLGGTSGHLLGGALAALLLGPWAGMLVMTCVVVLQALLFQDGGLLALGANIFNMGIVTAAIGYWLGMPLLQLLGGGRRGLILTGFAVGWLSVMAAAALTSLQLALSGLPALVVFPAMLLVHAAIGIGEGFITVAALAFIINARPELVPALAAGQDSAQAPSRLARGRLVSLIAVGLAFALGAALLAPLASPHPDGLERVAEDQGFIERALEPAYELLPDYSIPGIEGPLSTILSGVVGLLIVFTLIYGLSLLLRKRESIQDG
jgi:cobalt/nickel transport system permease protein